MNRSAFKCIILPVFRGEAAIFCLNNKLEIPLKASLFIPRLCIPISSAYDKNI